MKCWIIYNGFLESNKFIDYAQMLAEAATYYQHEVMMFKNSELINLLADENTLLFTDGKPDYIIFTDKDIYLAKQLELLGIPVFNSAESIEVSDDKIKTYQLLHHHQLPIPKTIIIPKTFGVQVNYGEDYMDTLIKQIGFPLIMKEAFGSFGEQVYLINNKHELSTYLHKLSHKALMVQAFISTSYGKDIRVQVVGDKVVAAMIRSTENDFRANITSGGRMSPYQPTALEQKIAIAANKAIGADFSGVDLLFGPNHEPIICEVNSNAHIRNLLECTGINAAYDMIKHIVHKIEYQTLQGDS